MTYRPHPHHRNRMPGKSQWTIPVADEITCFKRAATSGWLLNLAGWGLHIPNKNPDWLGVAQDHSTQVFIAKFVGRQQNQWHGYPADHCRNAQDIPHEQVLYAWIDSKLLSTAKIRKVMRGQRCCL